MALRRADARGDTRAEVREVALRAARAALMEAWYGEPMGDRRGARPRRTPTPTAPGAPGARYFLVERHGEPAASCELLGFDGIGRGRVRLHGARPTAATALASAVVRAAIAASRERGDDLVIIMADADDWPQRLYERLGFETVDGTARSPQAAS